MQHDHHCDDHCDDDDRCDHDWCDQSGESGDSVALKHHMMEKSSAGTIVDAHTNRHVKVEHCSAKAESAMILLLDIVFWKTYWDTFTVGCFSEN